MKCEYCTWSSDQLHVRFDYVGETVQEAKAFKAKAQSNVGRLKGSPWARVISSHRVVTIEIKYSKRKAEETFGTLSSSDIANKIQAELRRKIR